MGKRLKIFVDMDNTVVSNKGIVECCREDNPSLNIPEYGTVPLTWNFENYNLPNDFGKYFADERSYKKEYIMDNCVEVMEYLSKDYDIFICTRCSYGLDMKLKFIKENFPMVKGTIIVASEHFEDKSNIGNEWGNYLIDDKTQSFKDSKRFNILFGQYDYNKDIQGYRINKRCMNWLEIKNIIDKRKFMLED